jgi:hypothetical protein
VSDVLHRAGDEEQDDGSGGRLRDVVPSSGRLRDLTLVQNITEFINRLGNEHDVAWFIAKGVLSGIDCCMEKGRWLRHADPGHGLRAPHRSSSLAASSSRRLASKGVSGQHED